MDCGLEDYLEVLSRDVMGMWSLLQQRSLWWLYRGELKESKDEMGRD